MLVPLFPALEKSPVPGENPGARFEVRRELEEEAPHQGPRTGIRAQGLEQGAAAPAGAEGTRRAPAPRSRQEAGRGRRCPPQRGEAGVAVGESRRGPKDRPCPSCLPLAPHLSLNNKGSCSLCLVVPRRGGPERPFWGHSLRPGLFPAPVWPGRPAPDTSGSQPVAPTSVCPLTCPPPLLSFICT